MTANSRYMVESRWDYFMQYVRKVRKTYYLSGHQETVILWYDFLDWLKKPEEMRQRILAAADARIPAAENVCEDCDGKPVDIA